MKTEEDEAFDELARKQGMWGGGFQAKRAMAADKLQETNITRPCRSCDGTGNRDTGIAESPIATCKPCKGTGEIALAQPAQEPSNGMPTSKAERQLRRMLCFQRHSHKAYMDDGEASFCGDEFHRSIDYMRESPDAIENAWHQAGLKRLAAYCDKLAQPAQEPVAWNKQIRDSVDSLLEQAGYQPDSSARNALSLMNFDAPLLPMQREWVGLTDEEIDYQAKKDDHGAYFALGALWAEAKLKNKNA